MSEQIINENEQNLIEEIENEEILQQSYNKFYDINMLI